MSKIALKRPLSVEGLATLFSNPRKFFSGTFELKHVVSLLVLYFMWINSGNSGASGLEDGLLPENLNEDIVKSYLSPKTADWGFGFGQTVMSTLSGGFIFGYYVFWFYVKAYICGFRSDENVNFMSLAAVYLYAEAIFHVPIFVHRLLQALVYSDPTMAAFDTNQVLFVTCCSILNILSCIVGYQAMQCVFGLSAQKVRLLFRDLPIFFYFVTWSATV